MDVASIIVAGLLGAAQAAQAYPPPAPYYYQRPRYVPRQSYMSYPDQQSWKRAILDEANKYCNAFPSDQICKFQGPPR